jgi:ATP/maltotriose-dependent transcriptional regulator MalT
MSVAITRGREALARADWEAARDAFEEALSERPGDASALDGLGEARWWTGDWAGARSLREKAFVRYKALAGGSIDAARVAIWLANEHLVAHGNRAAWNGWLARAAELLEGAPTCIERGWLVLCRGRRSDDPAAIARASEEALRIARELGDPDLEAFALSQLGRALVALGRLDEGFARLDAAMAQVTAGEIQSHTAIAETCCNMLTTCEGAADMERLAHWCRVTDAMNERLKGKTMYAFCRFNYASVLIARGRWAEAEVQLRQAIEISREAYPSYTAHMLARLADLRLAQGRVAEAAELLEGMEELAAATLAAARLRIARGEPSAAAKLLSRRLSQVADDLVASAPLHAVLVEAHLAVGDVAGARRAASALAENARASGRVACLAAADLAAGLCALAGDAEGERGEAYRHLDRARERFAGLGMPLEVARARLGQAKAVAVDDPDAAREMARGARAEFDRLGAARDADRAAEVLRDLGVGVGPGKRTEGILSRREEEVLALLGLGLSNPEIGKRLFISPKTVEHHVGKILAKLGLKNRAAAAAHAVKRGRAKPGER